MILEFSVENFRSIKNRQTLSMVAESSKAKGDNVFSMALPGNDSVRLLKSAVIYGANASGKSNLIRALGAMIELIVIRGASAGSPIRQYDPFLFSPETQDNPTAFELVFVLNNVKFKYRIAFDGMHILEEEMVHFPKGQTKQIFKRMAQPEGALHKVKLAKDYGNKELDVFSNYSALSTFGREHPHELLTPVFIYFKNITISPFDRKPSTRSRYYERLSQPEGQATFIKLRKLIRAADDQIENLEISRDEVQVPVARRSVDEAEKTFVSMVKVSFLSVHNVFDASSQKTGIAAIDFEEESEGTKALLWRGSLILEKLERGGVLVVDEMDNSLHPKLAKFLVMLFTNPQSNPGKAQLIFATHEVTLLDRNFFRTDQIWFAEKNKLGETELYSAQDFDGVREDVPFDKWYMAGKFGGLPNLQDIETIFSHG
ncbi:MAG TPA: ATP-binding protein [Saprospiraceae bacterium]|nr:ATP-binding protein [Saprospiraceae bacterium]